VEEPIRYLPCDRTNIPGIKLASVPFEGAFVGDIFRESYEGSLTLLIRTQAAHFDNYR